jgi:hypothetical protein
LQLPEAALSRETLEVVHDVEGVLIRSVSGDSVIQLTGYRYKARRLRDRDELQVGMTRIMFEEPAQNEIDALKGAPDQPLALNKTHRHTSGVSAPLERTQTANPSQQGKRPSRPSKPSDSQQRPASAVPRGGPTVAELVIYALAIAVLLASGLALVLLLKAR